MRLTRAKLFSLLVSFAALAACDGARTHLDVVTAALGEADDPIRVDAPTLRSEPELAADASRWFRVNVTEHDGLRVAVRSVGAVDVTLHRDGPAGPVIASATDGTLHTLFVRADQGGADDAWWLEVHADVATTFDLTIDTRRALPLAFDQGASLIGDAVTNPGFGDYLFTINTEPTDWEAWRSVLRVTAGEADLRMTRGDYADDGAPHQSSNVGSDHVVLTPDNFGINEQWTLRVRAKTGNAAWTLVSGELYVRDLGAVGPDATPIVLDLDVGKAWFKTQVASDAWNLEGPAKLWVNDTTAPIPGIASRVDLQGDGHLLVVPSYLHPGQYVVAVEANTTSVAIASHAQPIHDAAFTSTTTGNSTSAHITYRFDVPSDPAAWHITARSSKPVDLYVAKGRVPAAYDNDALSETAGTLPDAVTIVPPALSDGGWYVTLVGTPPFDFTLTSGEPAVTTMPFVGATTNAAPHLDGTGWRYFRVLDIDSQLSSLGWVLDLANAPAGSEIAIRMSALPSRYLSRTYGQAETDHREWDHWSGRDYLESPDHNAGVWYVGVYSPRAAHGAFTLTTRTITPDTLDFDGGSATVSGERGRWKFFKVVVPNTASVVGWDLRVDQVSVGAAPRMVIRKLGLPFGLHFWPNRPYYDNPALMHASWPDRAQYMVGEGLGYAPGVDDLFAAMPGPIAPETYYVGVLDPGEAGLPISYRVRSRGVGVGHALPVIPLAYDGGSTTLEVPANEVRVVSVDVPEGAESFGLQLASTPGSADSQMWVRQGGLPNHWASNSSSDSPQGAWRERAGDDHFDRFASDAAGLPARRWYGVVHGGIASQQRTGTATTATITSSPLEVVGGETSVVRPGETLRFEHHTLPYGRHRAFRFKAEGDIASMELRVPARSGTPRMSFIDGARLPESGGTRYYGAEGGVSIWAGHRGDVLTIVEPGGLYTVLVTATSPPGTETESAADFDLVISANAIGAIDFNGGSVSVTDQPSRAWRYFRINVPNQPGLLGWDLRLRDVTSGKPRMSVRREHPPWDLSTWPGYWEGALGDRERWEPGHQMAASGDGLHGTAHSYLNGAGEYVRLSGQSLLVGMNAPLEPGSYIVGISDDYDGPPMSYRLVSRGIGDGFDPDGAPWAIGVTDITMGTTESGSAPAGEYTVYRTTFDPAVESYSIRLDNEVGDAMFAVGYDRLPNDTAENVAPEERRFGAVRNKGGSDYYYYYKDPDHLDRPGIAPYYIVVGAQGTARDNRHAGNSTWTLVTKTDIEVSEPEVEPTFTALGGWWSEWLDYTEERTYHVTLPPGTISAAVRLEILGGQPLVMTTRSSAAPRRHPYGSSGLGGYPAASYGVYGDAMTFGDHPTELTFTVTAGYIQSPCAFNLTIEAIGESTLAMNGGTARVEDARGGSWRYFRVEVPDSALGWDLALTDMTGSPNMRIRKDEAPKGDDPMPSWFESTPELHPWPYGYAMDAGAGYANQYTTSGDGQYLGGRRKTLVKGAPLSAGSYVVGVISSGTASYTITSRGIGEGNHPDGTPWNIQPRTIQLDAPTVVSGIAPGDFELLKFEVPPTTVGWTVELEPIVDASGTVGESFFVMKRGGLPSEAAWSGAGAQSIQGTRYDRLGADHLSMLQTTDVPSGTYYALVVSEGHDPYRRDYWGTDHRGLGTVDARFTVKSPKPIYGAGVHEVDGPMAVLRDAPIVFPNQRLTYSDTKLYRVRVPSDSTLPGWEVRFDNVVGEPHFRYLIDAEGEGRVPQPYNYRGVTGWEGGTEPGYYFGMSSQTFVGASGDITIAVADPDGSVADMQYDLVVRPMAIEDLAWDGGQDTAVLGDGEVHFYRVDVPPPCDGVPIAGWVVRREDTAGSAVISVRRGALPNGPAVAGATATFTTSEREAVIAPPYFTPGTWYVAVRGVGASEVTIKTRAVTAERTWTMPKLGASDGNAQDGLTLPVFADTGLDDDGGDVSQDNGVALGAGAARFYRVRVPVGNAGILKTQLIAISGDPELYIRRGGAPTLDHGANGEGGELIDWRDDQSVGSTYGPWVPADQRSATELEPGDYWLMVRANGGSVRYRLIVDAGRTTELPLVGGVTNQGLAGGDMRWYRVTIPAGAVAANDSAPLAWDVTLTQVSGDVTVFLRETLPPGFDVRTPRGNEDPLSLVRDWNGDRDATLYGLTSLPRIGESGTTRFAIPVVRPGTVYVLGVYARGTSALFDLASAVGAGRLAVREVVAYDGAITTTLPSGESLYRIDVPSEAAFFAQAGSLPSGITASLSVGFVPPLTNRADWYLADGGDAVFAKALLSPTGRRGTWPFVPGTSWYLRFDNQSGGPVVVALDLTGKPYVSDSDDDGLADGWELEGFGTLDGAADGDPDDDRLDNLAEQELGTPPNDDDADDDRLDDWLEGIAGSDPWVADSDGDDGCDGVESAPTLSIEQGPIVFGKLGVVDGGVYGEGFGSDVHDTRLAFHFDKPAGDAVLFHLVGWDIDGADEVEILLNGVSLGYVNVGGDGVASIPQVWWLDTSRLVKRTNRIDLVQKTRGESWGVKELAILPLGTKLGADTVGFHDVRHARGFDLYWPEPPDALVEMQTFDVDVRGEIAWSHGGGAWLDMPTTGAREWGRHWQVPILARDYAGTAVWSVRPVASDGDWQIRLNAARPIGTTFGVGGVLGEGDHAAAGIAVLVPVKPERRELAVRHELGDGEVIGVATSMDDGSASDGSMLVGDGFGYWFSDADAQDHVTLDRGTPSGLYALTVVYYGPCTDVDGNGVLDCVSCDGEGLGVACDGDDGDSCAGGITTCDESGNVVCNDDATSLVGEGGACDGADGDSCKGGVMVCDAAGTGLVCSDDAASLVGEGDACDGADGDSCKAGVMVCDGAGTGLVCDESGTVSGVGVACDGDDADTCKGGVTTCDAAGTIVCSDDAASLVGEGVACDGADVDTCKGGVMVCDANGTGLVCDESGTTPGVGVACDGDDADTCKGGVTTCDASGAIVCSDDAASLVGEGAACDGADVDTCKGGVMACDANGTGLVCDESGTISGVGIACDGADADTCKGGVTTCDASGAIVCSDDAASLVGEGVACDGPDSDLCRGGVMACDATGLGLVCSGDGAAAIGARCDGNDADTCKGGVTTCDASGAVVCSDDAASLVDEGRACDGADADTCEGGVRVCDAAGTGLVCNDDAASLLGEGRACDGADVDSCEGGVMVCAPSGKALVCNDDAASLFGEGSACDGDDADTCRAGVMVCAGSGTALVCAEDGAMRGVGVACDGNDRDTCKGGVTTCDASGAIVCNDDAGSLVGEGTSCDGADGDTCRGGVLVCDATGRGLVCNDDVASLDGEGRPCGDPDTCADGHLVCDAAGTRLVCAARSSVGMGLRCDGDDDDTCMGGHMICDEGGLVCDDDPGSLTSEGGACDGADADSCLDGRWVCDTLGTDLVCDDDATSHDEICNDVDDDCDGTTDEGCPGNPCVDDDDDGHAAIDEACPSGDDCDDADPEVVGPCPCGDDASDACGPTEPQPEAAEPQPEVAEPQPEAEAEQTEPQPDVAEPQPEVAEPQPEQAEQVGFEVAGGACGGAGPSGLALALGALLMLAVRARVRRSR